jgi:5-formyltetrahydrofolate cyclo-ligase
MEERIALINQLYHKSKQEGLSDAEKELQTKLRREYIDQIKAGLKGHLDRIDLVSADGTVENVAKRRIRKEVLSKRDAMSAEERHIASIALTERILGHQWFYGARKLLCFVSYGSEIETRHILEEALRVGKEVYVPKVEIDKKKDATVKDAKMSNAKLNLIKTDDAKVDYAQVGNTQADNTEIGNAKVGNTQHLSFYRLKSMNDLHLGYKGIPEPSGESEPYTYQPDETDILLLMPGVAFDPYKRRLGYGRGFYDRFLADKEILTQHSIAIGFACQLVDEIEENEWDIKPYQVILI